MCPERAGVSILHAVRGSIVIAALLAATAAAPALGASPTATATRLAAGVGGDVGVSIRCGERTVEVNPTQRLRAASTLKVAAALAAIRAEALDGSAIAADPELRAMIIDSDNDAANAVIARGGNFAGVNALMGELAMDDSIIDAPYGQSITTMRKATTARDLRLLADAVNSLAASGAGPLADMGFARAQGQALVGLMERVTHPGLVSRAGAKVAHKSGWLPGVENDLAIVRFPGRAACTLGIVTDGAGTYGAQALGAALMRDVVKPLAQRPASDVARDPDVAPDAAPTRPGATPDPPRATDPIAALAAWCDQIWGALTSLLGGRGSTEASDI